MTDFLDCMRPPIPDERRQPCTKRTWCVLDEGHDGDCVEVPRREMPPSEFGPEASKRRRY